MMNIQQLLRTKGNFETFSTRDFPLDCQGMASIQTNAQLLAILGNIGGDKYILGGDDTRGYYVFLSTSAAPQGELLYLKPFAGSSPNTICVVTSPVNITAQNRQYNNAYTQRWLEFGTGAEQFNWSEFKTVETNLSLKNSITALEERLVPAVPRGVITMWSGNGSNVPEGWAMCDGSQGTPDLRGRFIVGSSDTDSDYKGSTQYSSKASGSTSKTVTLGTDHLPPHNHGGNYVGTINNGYPDGSSDRGDGRGSGSYVLGSVPIASEGKGFSFDIRPPYYALAFIMKL